MNTLIIYDEQGYILTARSGQPFPKEPVGVPFLWVEIPEGKQIDYEKGVDVSKTPHQVCLKEIPASTLKVVEERVAELEDIVLMLTM